MARTKGAKNKIKKVEVKLGSYKKDETCSEIIVNLRKLKNDKKNSGYLVSIESVLNDSFMKDIEQDYYAPSKGGARRIMSQLVKKFLV